MPSAVALAGIGPCTTCGGGIAPGDYAAARACSLEQIMYNGKLSPGVEVWWPMYSPPAADNLDGVHWSLPSSPGPSANMPGVGDTAPAGTAGAKPGFNDQVNSFSLPAGTENDMPGNLNGIPNGTVIAWFNPPASGFSATAMPPPLANGGTFAYAGGTGPYSYSWSCRPADAMAPPLKKQPNNPTVTCAALPTAGGYDTPGSTPGAETLAPSVCNVDGGMPPGTIPTLTASLPNGTVNIGGNNRDFVVDVPTSGTATTQPWSDPVVANTYQIVPGANFTGTISILFYPIANNNGTPDTLQSIPAGSGHDTPGGSTYQWQWYSCTDPTSEWLTDNTATQRSGGPATITYSATPPWSALSTSGDTYVSAAGGGQIYTNTFPAPGTCGPGYTISAVQYWAVQCKAYFVWTQPVSGIKFDYDEQSAVAFASWASTPSELAGSSQPLSFDVTSQDLCDGQVYFQQTFTEPASPSGPPHPVVQFEPIGIPSAG